MRVRFGAILCLILGAILIHSGLAASESSAVGFVDPCPVTVGEVLGSCPLGTLTLNEVTHANGNTTVAPPAEGWAVHLTVSPNCPDPSDPNKNVSNNGTVTWTDLYIYNGSETARCEYTINEDSVDPYTASFDPPAPYTFLDDAILLPTDSKPNSTTTTAQTVTLTNTAKAPPASSTPASPTPTKTKTTSASASASATKTAPSEPGGSTSAPVASSSAGPVLASTGPHRPIRASLIAGIALVLLGGFLLFAGRRPRRARHG